MARIAAADSIKPISRNEKGLFFAFAMKKVTAMSLPSEITGRISSAESARSASFSLSHIALYSRVRQNSA